MFIELLQTLLPVISADWSWHMGGHIRWLGRGRNKWTGNRMGDRKCYQAEKTSWAWTTSTWTPTSKRRKRSTTTGKTEASATAWCQSLFVKYLCIYSFTNSNSSMKETITLLNSTQPSSALDYCSWISSSIQFTSLSDETLTIQNRGKLNNVVPIWIACFTSFNQSKNRAE